MQSAIFSFHILHPEVDDSSACQNIEQVTKHDVATAEATYWIQATRNLRARTMYKCQILLQKQFHSPYTVVTQNFVIKMLK
jgi:hypothetical protein